MGQFLFTIHTCFSSGPTSYMNTTCWNANDRQYESRLIGADTEWSSYQPSPPRQALNPSSIIIFFNICTVIISKVLRNAFQHTNSVWVCVCLLFDIFTHFGSGLHAAIASSGCCEFLASAIYNVGRRWRGLPAYSPEDRRRTVKNVRWCDVGISKIKTETVVISLQKTGLLNCINVLELIETKKKASASVSGHRRCERSEIKNVFSFLIKNSNSIDIIR